MKKKKKIKIHRVKKRTNVSTSRMRKANGWVGKTGDQMQRVKAQPHASLNFIGRTHSISVHQFSMRNNGIRGILGAVPVVFTGRFYSKLVPGPTILHVLTPAFLVKMNARVSTPSIHRSVLRITSTFIYTRCALRPERRKEFSINFQMGSLYEVESITRGMIKYVIIMLKRIYAIKSERIFALPYVSSVDKRRE